MRPVVAVCINGTVADRSVAQAHSLALAVDLRMPLPQPAECVVNDVVGLPGAGNTCCQPPESVAEARKN